MNRLVASVLILVIATTAWADDKRNLDSTMDGLAADLSALQKDVESTTTAPQAHYSNTVKRVRLTQANAAIYNGADRSSEVLTNFPMGKTLPVVDKAGDWYAVLLDNKVGEYQVGWVPASAVVPETFNLTPPPPIKSDTYQKLMDNVKSLKEKYSNNPYVKVTGFSVDIGIPPAVSIDFEFK